MREHVSVTVLVFQSHRDCFVGRQTHVTSNRWVERQRCVVCVLWRGTWQWWRKLTRWRRWKVRLERHWRADLWWRYRGVLPVVVLYRCRSRHDTAATWGAARAEIAPVVHQCRTDIVQLVAIWINNTQVSFSSPLFILELSISKRFQTANITCSFITRQPKIKQMLFLNWIQRLISLFTGEQSIAAYIHRNNNRASKKIFFRFA